jgi:hypothetical protein
VRNFCLESNKVRGIIVRNGIDSDVRARAHLTQADESVMNEFYRGRLIDDGIKCDRDRAPSEQHEYE